MWEYFLHVSDNVFPIWESQGSRVRSAISSASVWYTLWERFTGPVNTIVDAPRLVCLSRYPCWTLPIFSLFRHSDSLSLPFIHFFHRALLRNLSKRHDKPKPLPSENLATFFHGQKWRSLVWAPHAVGNTITAAKGRLTHILNIACVSYTEEIYIYNW